MKKISLFCIFLLLCMSLFAENPIIIEDDDSKLVWELVSDERAEKLKELYESKYDYVTIIDKNEITGNKGTGVIDITVTRIQSQLGEISKGDYKIASVLLTYKSNKLIGFIYYGYDYFFILFFTNRPFGDSYNLDLKHVRNKYETVLRNEWDFLLPE